jgi:hypothetical protein
MTPNVVHIPGPLDRVTAESVHALAAFRLTERQARFLVEVMIHGGVFVPRQYDAFAGIVHGQKTHDFLYKLVACGYARPIQVGAVHRGRLYHVTYKPLYAAIGEADNRHRKAMSLGRMVQRLMLLDAVLADRTFTWLGAERDKYNYFVRLLHERVQTREFPHLTFGREPQLTVRFFPDKLPIGVQADRTEHVFLYVVTSAVPVDFRLFLFTHAELLRALPRWTIRVLVPQPFAKAIPRFGQAAREELATPLSLSQSQDLQWWFRERRCRQSEGVTAADERSQLAAAAFRAPRFRVLYRLWQQHGDRAIWSAQSAVLRDALDRQTGRVEFIRLSHQYLHLSSLVGVA